VQQLLPLFPYQDVGRDFLVGKKIGLLADEMGLGKSAQAIRALEKLPCPAPSLVVCPAVARRNWAREFIKFGIEFPHSHVIEKAQDLQSWNLRSHLIISYNFAPQLLLWLQEKQKKFFTGQIKVFSAVVCDEVHMLKNMQSQRTKTVLGSEGLARYGRRFWALSGTPMPNHAGELWTLLYTMGATKLSYWKFVEKFCNTYGGFSKVGWSPTIVSGTKKSAIPELRKVLAPVMLRRQVKDVDIDLPPLIFSDPITLEKPERIPDADFTDGELKNLKAQRIQLLGIQQDHGLTAEALTLLAPSVATLRRYTGLMKVEGVSKLVNDELLHKAYDKIIIFAVHKQVIRSLLARLWLYGPVSITGETSPHAREVRIKNFMTLPKCKVLIGNIQACGTAINLTAASQVLFAEQSWTPGDNAQAVKRAHRIGTRETVFVRTCSLDESMDARINEVLKEKTESICLTFD